MRSPASRFGAVPVALLVAILGLLATAVVTLAESPAPGATGAPAPSGGSAISIIQKTFQPADVTIHVGDTVTWTVTEAISDSHSVTSGLYTDSKPGTVFDSGIVLRNNGDHFSHTFDQAGTFSYFCAVHPDTMHGTITVEAAANGSGEAASTDATGKLITAGVLVVALVVLFGWARLYRRMNPAT